MKKLLYIYNPMSGQRTIGNYLSQIIEFFSKSSYFPTVYATQKANDAREKVIEFARDYDEILVSGGDGTLDEVVSGLLKSKKKFNNRIYSDRINKWFFKILKNSRRYKKINKTSHKRRSYGYRCGPI